MHVHEVRPAGLRNGGCLGLGVPGPVRVGPRAKPAKTIVYSMVMFHVRTASRSGSEPSIRRYLQPRHAPVL